MGGEAEHPAQGGGEGEDTERSTEGGVVRDGEGAGAAEEDEADVDLEVGVAEGEQTPRGEGGMPKSNPVARQRTMDWERRCGKKPVSPETACTPSSSKSVVPDTACTSGSSKRKDGGAHISATNEGKRLRQQKMTDTYGGEWIGRWRKAFFRWVYSSGIACNAFCNTPWRDLQQVALQQPGGAPLPVLPSHIEITSMRAVFSGPQRVNAICTDSASAYVGAARALASTAMPPELRRITWLPCCVHVCNKLLSDIGTICTSCVDTITRARVLVVFFKTHQATLSFFQKRSGALGLVLSCETRFASVYCRIGALGLALQDRLQGMMTAEDGRAWARIPWSPDVRDMARWVRRQIRWSPWWERMRAIKHVMDPVMDLLRQMDHGGQFISLNREWTWDLARLVRDACIPLGQSFSDHVMRRVQARIQHMMEPAYCAAFLLKPRRWVVQYFSVQLDQYHTWLVRQAKRYLLSGGRYLEVCQQFEDFHTQQGRYGTWGGGEGRARARSCSGDCEMLECASWWSQYGGEALDLQHCALRLMPMWSCASPAERNWAPWVVYVGIHMKKRNQLAFEKVVHLVDITANVRLMEYRRAGCGYVLPWQRDEGMLDAQAGLDLAPVRSGTRNGMTEDEIEEQAALVTHDPIGSSAPPPVESVFNACVAIFRPYPGTMPLGTRASRTQRTTPCFPSGMRLTSCTRRATSGAARPRPMPAAGGAALGESSGPEGLGMPRGSCREKTVTEVTQVSARVVRVRTGADPMTVVEDNPETELACEEAQQAGDDECRDDEESEEEESDNREDDNYDDDDEPSPPSVRGSSRRCGSSRRRDDVDDPSPPGRRETRSQRRRGSSVATVLGRGSVSLTRSTGGGRQRGSGKGKGCRRY
ncbi:hypothetical protein CBR_g37852 [Chara braunii]|uniref:DUF659 domain-containing protein n=1 Tax=Chara braunii TaxID=69332 RepID=A0A388LNQ4_CHABU|nr:hypothetical protein CBR_g37852 [Chara braunii]|eukprot:GBG83980.1 hypothetical protein CBR_g37852 [Chara braunii]